MIIFQSPRCRVIDLPTEIEGIKMISGLRKDPPPFFTPLAIVSGGVLVGSWPPRCPRQIIEQGVDEFEFWLNGGSPPGAIGFRLPH